MEPVSSDWLAFAVTSNQLFNCDFDNWSQIQELFSWFLKIQGKLRLCLFISALHNALTVGSFLYLNDLFSTVHSLFFYTSYSYKEMSSVPISSAFVRKQMNPVNPETKTETAISKEKENNQTTVQQRQPFYNSFFTSYKDRRRVGKDVKTWGIKGSFKFNQPGITLYRFWGVLIDD